MIRQDCQLARAMASAVSDHPDLEFFTCHLSITTFRYVPSDLDMSAEERKDYLNELNELLLSRLQEDGEVFLSNAILQGGLFVLRACIVNFRTTLEDVEALPGIVVEEGKEIDARLRVDQINGRT